MPVFCLFQARKREGKKMEEKRIGTETECECIERERKTVAAVRKGLKCHLFFCLNGGTRVFSTLQMSPFFFKARFIVLFSHNAFYSSFRSVIDSRAIAATLFFSLQYSLFFIHWIFSSRSWYLSINLFRLRKNK